MPSLPVLVFIVFLVLKLTEVIDWSWWWVTSPLWITVLVVGAMYLIGFLVGAATLIFRRD